MTDQTVSLTSVEYTENPVLISKVLEVEGINVGYIMYNSFTGNFDSELNAAFTDLKAQGVQELVLDLRYNGGGSVESAVDLASMITGQFEGEIFMKEQWNAKYQQAWDPESYINRFNNKIRTGEAISSLGLGKVYVLTSRRSASASELVINGLDPYIDVVQVGTNTTGKFQASVTLYDSSNFGRENANPNHTYAIQPLVLKSVNSAGVSDYINGLAPDITKKEDLRDYGTLGDPSEPLLKAALNDILGISQEQTTATMKRAEENFRTFGESEMFDPTYQKMYIEKLPSSINLK
jgi:C-terminal processing protease CtpA/Prc